MREFLYNCYRKTPDSCDLLSIECCEDQLDLTPVLWLVGELCVGHKGLPARGVRRHLAHRNRLQALDYCLKLVTEERRAQG